MARIIHVKKAQQRYARVPVIDPATGEQKITAVTRKDGSPKITKCDGTGKVTPDDPNEDQMAEWQSEVADAVAIVDESPV